MAHLLLDALLQIGHVAGLVDMERKQAFSISPIFIFVFKPAALDFYLHASLGIQLLLLQPVFEVIEIDGGCQTDPDQHVVRVQPLLLFTFGKVYLGALVFLLVQPNVAIELFLVHDARLGRQLLRGHHLVCGGLMATKALLIIEVIVGRPQLVFIVVGGLEGWQILLLLRLSW